MESNKTVGKAHGPRAAAQARALLHVSTFVGLGLRCAEDVVGADVLHELNPGVKLA